MTYTVVVPQKVADELQELPAKRRAHIYAALDDLETDPFLGKKLSGRYHAYRSLRVGEYRIVYELRKTELIVLIIRIGTRQDVY